MLQKMKVLNLLFLIGFCRLVAGNQFRRSTEPSADEQTINQLLGSDPLAREFTKNTPHLSTDAMQKIEADLMKESQETEDVLATEAGKCIIDWSAPCPKHWKPKDKVETSEILCVAPTSYTGLCKTLVSFSLYTPEAKQDWANTCQVEWPCRGDLKESCLSGRRDFTLPCPEGFMLLDEETCVPDLSQYQGPCQGQASFVNFSDEAKKSWSETCGAVWPCWEECTNEYEALCPVGWTHTGNYTCVAPKHYGGPCAESWNFRFYTPGMKAKFERKCKVRFPCESTCEKNYALQCPKNWAQVDSSCKPPEGYLTCAIPRRPFTQLSLAEKASFETDCNAEWPCKEADVCERDWSFPCPEGWENIPPPGSDLTQMAESHHLSGITCAAPPGYTGKCGATEEFKSEEEKRKWSSNCDQPWPCKKTVEGKKLSDILLHPSKTIPKELLAAKGRRPRAPYFVVDKREAGKNGPVHHETGEVMPRVQKEKPSLEEMFGEKPVGYRHPSPRPLTPSQLQYITAALNAKAGKLGVGSQVPIMHQAPFLEKPYSSGPKGFYSGGYYLTGSVY